MDQNRTSDRGGNICHSNAGLNGSVVTAGAINIANNVNFSIDGVRFVVNAINNQAFPAGLNNLAAGCACLFAVWVASNNTISVTQGKIVATADLVASKTVIPYPDLVSSQALIGLIKVKTAGAATFAPGTTNCNATNVTWNFFNTETMPTIPLLT